MSEAPTTETYVTPEVEVLFETPKSKDVTYRISKVTGLGDKYLDFREFIPSLNKWGRGVTFPATPEILKALTDAIAEVS